jgi:hypothetical protein
MWKFAQGSANVPSLAAQACHFSNLAVTCDFARWYCQHYQPDFLVFAGFYRTPF